MVPLLKTFLILILSDSCQKSRAFLGFEKIRANFYENSCTNAWDYEITAARCSRDRRVYTHPDMCCYPIHDCWGQQGELGSYCFQDEAMVEPGWKEYGGGVRSQFCCWNICRRYDNCQADLETPFQEVLLVEKKRGGTNNNGPPPAPERTVRKVCCEKRIVEAGDKFCRTTVEDDPKGCKYGVQRGMYRYDETHPRTGKVLRKYVKFCCKDGHDTGWEGLMTSLMTLQDENPDAEILNVEPYATTVKARKAQIEAQAKQVTGPYYGRNSVGTNPGAPIPKFTTGFDPLSSLIHTTDPGLRDTLVQLDSANREVAAGRGGFLTNLWILFLRIWLIIRGAFRATFGQAAPMTIGPQQQRYGTNPAIQGPPQPGFGFDDGGGVGQQVGQPLNPNPDFGPAPAPQVPVAPSPPTSSPPTGAATTNPVNSRQTPR